MSGIAPVRDQVQILFALGLARNLTGLFQKKSPQAPAVTTVTIISTGFPASGKQVRGRKVVARDRPDHGGHVRHQLRPDRR
jgi:hypothetical protein